MDISTLLNAYREAAAWTILLLVGIGGMRGWYVWGPTHQRECRKNDELMVLVLQAAQLARGALDVTAKRH